MRLEEYEYMYQLEEQFWWYVGMRQITDAVVLRQLKDGSGRRILDAGCGTGFNLKHFSSIGVHDVFGLDLSEAAVDGVRRRGFHKVCQASITDIPYVSESFDLVLSFDVLCQTALPSVNAALREVHRVLRPGGFFFVRVPAFQWMRSSHDEAVESNRRFTCPEMATEIRKAGLEPEWSSYANCFLFPAVIARRVLKSVGIGKGSDVRPLPTGLGWIDSMFRGILGAEAAIFRNGGKLPFGLSVICLARKP